jgi:hypothetical protein
MRNVFEYYKEDDYLSHHGILGQKCGIRRFQNKDGSYTKAGEQRYTKNKSSESEWTAAGDKDVEAAYQKMRNSAKTDEEKDLNVWRFETANADDRYELDFLEAVQNSRALQDNDKKTLLMEYAAYLTDRPNYWERGRKLPPAGL